MRIVVLSTFFKANMSVSQLSAQLMCRLAELPAVGGRQNVAQVAGTVHGPKTTLDGFDVTPLGDNGIGKAGADMRVVAREIRAYAPDLVIVIFDARDVVGLVELLAPVPVWFWLPIDADPIPARDLAAIDGCALAISMSKFGLAQLERAGVEQRTYIPAPLDPAYCVGTDPAVRRAYRESMGGPGCEFLGIIVARYHEGPAGDRKAYAQQLRAWAEFAEDKPGARLYCHVPAEYDGEQLRSDGQQGVYEIARALGLAGRVRFPRGLTIQNGVPVDEMALQYGAADVAMLCSAAEGFGMPLTEAQACGTPVVCTDFTSMGELVRWGLAVPPLDAQWVNLLRSWRAWPDSHATATALQALYVTWQACGGRWPVERRRAVSAQIHAEYGWDVVFNRDWAPLLAQKEMERC